MPQKTVQQLQQKQRLLQIGVFTLVTVMIWVGFSVTQSQEKTKITPQQKKLASPLTPSINEDILDEIEAKQAYSTNELTTFPIYKIRVSEDGNTQEVVTIETPEFGSDSL